MWGELWGHPRWIRWSAGMQSVQIYSPIIWKAAYRSRGPWVTAPPLICSALANTRPMSVVVIPCPLSPPRDRDSQNNRDSIKCSQWSHKQDVIKYFDLELFSFIALQRYILKKWSCDSLCFFYELLLIFPPPDLRWVKTPRSQNYMILLPALHYL